MGVATWLWQKCSSSHQIWPASPLVPFRKHHCACPSGTHPYLPPVLISVANPSTLNFPPLATRTTHATAIDPSRSKNCISKHPKQATPSASPTPDSTATSFQSATHLRNPNSIMSFATEELNQLQKEILAKNPADVLQFCANYFNTRLALQRLHLWLVQAKAKAAGIDLFPKLDAVALDNKGLGVIPSTRQPSFKSPFGNNDPHSEHANTHSDDPVAPLASLFKGFGEKHSDSAKEVSPDDPTSKPKAAAKFPVAFNANRRVSVSAEAMNPDKFKLDSWKPPVNNLLPEQRAELAKTLALNFLFHQLDPTAKKTVVAALMKKEFPQGTEIITQGDVGDFFYIVESGTVDFYVNGTKVNTSGDGLSFGELALMYNSPRAATAIAASDVTCWALDRATFRRILLEGTFNRRIMYEDFLKDVNVLSGLTHQERLKLADALSTEIYRAGDKIVTEGETGDKFYLIESGSCEISKHDDGVIATISKGKYFGEVALLNDLPRQATVTAVDTVIVATLGKSGFTRLLGPALDVLRKQDPTAH